LKGLNKWGWGGGEGVMASETDCVGWGRVKRGVGGFQLASLNPTRQLKISNSMPETMDAMNCCYRPFVVHWGWVKRRGQTLLKRKPYCPEKNKKNKLSPFTASFHLEPSVVMVGIRILPPDPYDQTTGQGQAFFFRPRATIGQHNQVSIGTISERFWL